MNKHYLGDGAYVEFDGNSFVLTTEDGIKTTNTVYLDVTPLKNLFEYIKRTDPVFFDKIVKSLG